MLKKMLALSFTSAILLSGCSESVNLNEVKNLASKAEQLGEAVGSKELEQVGDTVEDVTKVFEILPEEVEEERLLKATITNCYDGDTCTATIKSTGKEEKLRFLLVDSSEIKGDPMPFAKEARDRLNELVKGKEILLERGVGNSRDKYNRLLVYGFLPTGENIQEMMLKEGLLVVRYIYEDTKYLVDYKNAMEDAKSRGIGIWSIPNFAGFDQPYNLDAVK